MRIAAGAALLLALLASPMPVQAQQEPARTHIVEAGDTLYSIARRYGLSVAELQRLNDLEGTTIAIGQTLAVRPDASPEAAPADTTAPTPPRPRIRIIDRTGSAADTAAADTVATPADTTATAPTAIPADTAAARADEPVVPGAADREAEEPAPYGTIVASASPELGAYLAEAGDTFYTIAQQFGVSVDTLWVLNEQRTAPLAPGDTVRLPASLASVAYEVRPGDTLSRIARTYGTSAQAIQRANDLDGTTLSIGQVLRVPAAGPSPEPAGPSEVPVFARGRLTPYPASFAGRLMAGGQPYDPEAFVVSHPTLPLGTVVLLTNPATDRQTFAVVADRGPLDEAFLMDASAAVLRTLAVEDNQAITVRLVDP